MIILPAIDLKDKTCVRLYKGDFATAHKVAEDAVSTAKKFEQAGAMWLHMVDLDGAKNAKPYNDDVIFDVKKNTNLHIEVGGGIRDMKRVEDYLNLGVKRVILGTAAIRNYPFVEEAVKEFGNAIAVGVDAKNGFVAVSGWQETTSVNSVEFCKKLRDTGVATVIYTDISKDGMLSGTNLEIYKELSKIEGLQIVASGGITFADEIRALNEMGIYGAIVGKAVYEGKLSLKDALIAGGAL
jgi:phosphoribosylformimino-5-aminoimidazole carboxamide ribotide isomerase